MTYALDTNIVIDLLNGEAAAIRNMNSILKSNAKITIPLVTDYEVLRGFCHTPSSQKEAAYKNFCLSCPVEVLTVDMWGHAASIWAKLRKKGRTIDDADILIAAFCILNGYTLITHNTKHFTDIDGLLFEDWT